MYHLDVLKSLNARAGAPVESETTRHCSFVQSAAGIVLHSAKQRSTIFLKGVSAAAFLRKVGVARSELRVDQIIESYFA